MVEEVNENSQEGGGSEEGWDEWDDSPEEVDHQAAARALMEELAEERKVEANMQLIEQMQRDREEKQASKAAKILGWKLIPVSRFVDLMKAELAEEQKVPLDQVSWSKLQEQNCSICYCELYEDIQNMSSGAVQKLNDEQMSYLKPIDVVQMSQCKGHFFHAECLESQLNANDGQFLRCGMCNAYYGVLRGKCPSGSMTIMGNAHKLPGYENDSVGTWRIEYRMSGGTKPDNGAQYHGDGRGAYLPMNAEGDEVLALLQIAFQRKLVFTVGFSPTRGCDNVICWNGIHHKTNMSGGPTRYGYPDETYLCRVKDELKQKNVYFATEEEKSAAVEKAKQTYSVETEEL